MSDIYLDKAQVPATLREGYSGAKFRARVCDKVHIPADAGLWSDGSRERYYAVNIATGQSIALQPSSSAPWDGARRDLDVEIPIGAAVVCHAIFCGRDTGLTIYVRSENAAELLPAPTAELTETQLRVIDATCGYKASYNGMDRYEMARGDRKYRDTEPFPTRDEWNAAKTELIEAGYLNRAGAITTKGRNARPSRY